LKGQATAKPFSSDKRIIFDVSITEREDASERLSPKRRRLARDDESTCSKLPTIASL
jgi:hypothetical protein